MAVLAQAGYHIADRLARRAAALAVEDTAPGAGILA